MSVKKYRFSLTSREVKTLCYALSRTFNFEKQLGIDEEGQASIWAIYTKAAALRERTMGLSQ